MQGTNWNYGPGRRRRRGRRGRARLRRLRRARRVRAALVAVVLVSLALAALYLAGNPGGLVDSANQEANKAVVKMREFLAITPTVSEPFIVSVLEDRVFALTNEERHNEGLAPLTLDPGISTIARRHSANMAYRRFSHDLQGKGPGERALAAGYPCEFGENIFKLHKRRNIEMTAIALVDGWMESPSHRRNILRPNATNIGVGIYVTEDNTVYATQNFDIC